jgi:hypothetical protein
MSSEPAYCYGRKLLSRVGWEMYLGDDGRGGERWEPITGVRINGDRVLITVTDGTTYATGYADAVRCRRPPPEGERGPDPLAVSGLSPCGGSGSRRAGRTVP